eukprot:TRINITY_DN235_c0_g1_i1.p2 TRINITY_DN235_c0_g1~~TRINITY_DN235_c0_g1_i1.p2  ORF type:complete len:533 (+),score=149.62 TRINITY_DN235_c0_g1_i1:1849-3447(+)
MPDDLIVVAFVAKWNKSANSVLPKFDSLSSEFEDDVSFVIDVDEMSDQLAEAKSAYQNVPAFYFYRDGACLKKLNQCENPSQLDQTWRKYHGGSRFGADGDDEPSSGRQRGNSNMNREMKQMKVFFSGPQTRTTTSTTTTKKKKDPFSSFMKKVDRAVDKEFNQSPRSRNTSKSSGKSSQTTTTTNANGTTTTTTTKTLSPRGIFGGRKKSTSSTTTTTSTTNATSPRTVPSSGTASMYESEINDMFGDLEMMEVADDDNPNGPPPPIPSRAAGGVSHPHVRKVSLPRSASRGAASPRAAPRTVVSPRTQPRNQSSPRVVTPATAAVSPRSSPSPQTVSPRAASPRAPSSPRAQSPRSIEASSSSKKLPDYMRPVARPNHLPNLPPFDKLRYTKFECDWMVGHVKWHLTKVLKNAKTIRERGLELTAEFQEILMRRVIASAKEIKVIVHLLKQMDTLVESSLKKQDKLALDTDDMVKKTILFIQKCQGIAKGTVDVSEFDSSFNLFVAAASLVNTDVKFVHFDQKDEFRLRV